MTPRLSAAPPGSPLTDEDERSGDMPVSATGAPARRAVLPLDRVLVVPERPDHVLALVGRHELRERARVRGHLRYRPGRYFLFRREHGPMAEPKCRARSFRSDSRSQPMCQGHRHRRQPTVADLRRRSGQARPGRARLHAPRRTCAHSARPPAVTAPCAAEDFWLRYSPRTPSGFLSTASCSSTSPSAPSITCLDKSSAKRG